MSSDLRLQLIEKLLSGIPAEAILSAAERSELNTGELVAQLNAIHRDRRISSRRQQVSRTHANWMASVRRRTLEGQTTVVSVETIEGNKFYRGYYEQNRPLLFSKICQHDGNYFKWSFGSIRQKYGAEIVGVMRGRTDNPADSNHLGSLTQMNLGDFIDEILTRVTNDIYMTPSGDAVHGPLGDLVQGFDPLPQIVEAQWNPESNAVFWMGPKGALSGLHYDTRNVLIVPLMGDKSVVLIPPNDYCFLYKIDGIPRSRVDISSPDLHRFPLFRYAHQFQIVLSPGSALFVPVGWWHSVESLTPSLSVTMKKFRAPNFFPDGPS